MAHSNPALGTTAPPPYAMHQPQSYAMQQQPHTILPPVQPNPPPYQPPTAPTTNTNTADVAPPQLDYGVDYGVDYGASRATTVFPDTSGIAAATGPEKANLY